MKKVFLALVIAAAMGLFFVLDLQSHLTLAAVKSHQNVLREYYQMQPFIALCVYCAFYVAVTALSLPAATVLTLLGSAIFGFWPALVAVSVSSSVGATIAFLLSRYLFKDLVRAKFAGPRLESIDQGVRTNGVFYLFALRLTPVFPFFLVNLTMGLTSISVATFYIVSQVGMLPATAIYVNAGMQLGAIEQARDVFSWKVFFSLTALGLAPLGFKQLVRRLRPLS